MVIQAAKDPYMSEEDNEAGDRWNHVLSAELESSSFGILCLTPSNLHSDWILFEAGALGKLVSSRARVVCLLYNLAPNDVGLPLSQFMMKQLDEGGVFDTVKAMNGAVEEKDRLPEPNLVRLFKNCWDDLNDELKAVPPGKGPRRRDDRELLEELLDLARRSSAFVSNNVTVSASKTWDRSYYVGATRKVLPRLKAIARGDDVKISDDNRLVEVYPQVVIEEVPVEDKAELWDIQRELDDRGIQLRVHWISS